MSENVIVPFVSLQERTARENLEAYIERAKSKHFFRGNNALDWNDNVWDLRPFAQTRGQNPSGYVVHFAIQESKMPGTRKPIRDAMTEPFLSAAKAIIVDYLIRSQMASPDKWMSALKIIEKALRDLGLKPDICLVSHSVLDHAAAMVSQNYTNPWHVGRALERISDEVLNIGRMTEKHLIWQSPFLWKKAKRTSNVGTSSGVDESSGKLPHLKCILDLAGVFQTAHIPVDVVTTAWTALAMFAPSRINEVLTLPVNCETMMDGVYGLSWRPLKGGDPMTKFATGEEWAAVVREAIRRLRDLGAPARRAAAWYTENPDKLYLPPGFEHLRGEPLTIWEIYKIIGKAGEFKQNRRMDEYLKAAGKTTNDSARVGGASWGKLYDFSSVERYVFSLLPRDFPVADKRSGLLAADALFCLPLHIMRTDGETLQHIPDLISKAQIAHDLGSKPGGTTIFFRHQLIDPSTGETWKLQSHQPRHLLNTLAQSKHVSETLIAFWSGRKNVEQNEWYNHVPHEFFIQAYVTMGANAPRDLAAVGPLADKVEERARLEVISHDDALRLEVGSIISTRFGLCRHNYALTPCPKDKNCISCGENTFIKGDQRQIEEARKQLEISRNAVKNCRKAMDDDEPGVERWLSKHEEAASRWELALAQLTDPNIAEGTLITLPPPKVSQTRTGLAFAIREAEGPAIASGQLDMMKDFLALGGNT